MDVVVYIIKTINPFKGQRYFNCGKTRHKVTAKQKLKIKKIQEQ